MNLGIKKNKSVISKIALFIKIRNYKLITLDFTMAVISFMLALALRSDSIFPRVITPSLLIGVFSSVLITISSGVTLGIYSNKYVLGSFEETLALNTQVFIGTIVTLGIRFLQSNQGNYPRSIPIMAGIIFVFLALAIRVLFRLKISNLPLNNKNARHILIYGAGKLGSHIGNLVLMDPNLNLVGYIDDDPDKTRTIIKGKKVICNLLNLENLIENLKIDQIVIAISNLDNKKFELVQNLANENKISIKVFSSASQLVVGVENLQELITINEQNLLGRNSFKVDQSEVKRLMRNKRILITGAGGSIGSEIARQVVNFSPGEVFILDRDETALHSLELELFGSGSMNSEFLILSDIRDRNAIFELFKQIKPNIVFHAAALKHLSILERFPEEAFKTNVEGTKNILEACIENEVSIFVNISTDKAADPNSQLGITKLEGELMTAKASQLLANKESNYKYISVRFGNVIGSRGSVLHTFKHQIDANLPLTVTDSNVTRYFMTVKEAVELVLQSAVYGDNGETLILDMGKPVRIEDIARFMIAQSGKNLPIKYVGLRKGEKLHEILSSKTERLENRHHPKIFHTRVSDE